MTNTHTSRLGPLVDPTKFNKSIRLADIDSNRAEQWLRSMLLIRRAEESIGRRISFVATAARWLICPHLHHPMH